MVCKLCGEAQPLIKAHIIPAPFFTEPLSGGGDLRMISTKTREFPKKAPVGAYDSTILCGPCDRGLGVWDQYAVQAFLRDLQTRQWLYEGPRKMALQVPDVDYPRLKLFFLSLLWRAGVSAHPFFGRVHLGGFADTLHAMIRARDPGDADAFSVVLSVFTLDGTDLTDLALVMDPFRERWEGINAYRFCFGAVTAIVKVDRRPFVGSFRRLALAPDRPLLLIEREFLASAEARAARSVALRPHNRTYFDRRQARRVRPSDGR